MLTILSKIPVVLGVLLLVLIGLLLLAVLAVLFVPVIYRVHVEKQNELHIAVRVNWLLGLVRVRFFYPHPGNVIAKVLCFKVYDSGGINSHDNATGETAGRTPKPKRQGMEQPRGAASQDGPDQDEPDQDKPDQDKPDQDRTAQQSEGEPAPGSFFEKLQYTFRNLCDKIKDIRENTAYYREILLCEDTKGLLNHAFLRLGKILKSIRPRKLKADVRFGTGSPDTTGYAFAIYGVLCPYLGRQVLVVPDFERAVLEGEFYAAGHITVFRLLWNGLMLVFDKRLQELRVKLKREE